MAQADGALSASVQGKRYQSKEAASVGDLKQDPNGPLAGQGKTVHLSEASLHGISAGVAQGPRYPRGPPFNSYLHWVGCQKF